MEMKTKREAAALLGVSTRGIERAVQRGHLSVLYRDSKHGKKAWFRADELKELKNRQDDRGPVGFTSGIPGPPIGTLVPMVEMKPSHKGREPEAGVPISERLTLAVDAAVQLSGLPRSFIVDNIRSGKLKAITIGRRHYIKRADLNAFVEKL